MLQGDENERGKEMSKQKVFEAVDSYSLADDIYSVKRKKADYDSSVQHGDFIFDLDKNKNIIGLEIMHASKKLKIPKEFLRNISKGDINITISSDRIQIEIELTYKVRNHFTNRGLSITDIKPDFLSESNTSLTV